MERNGERQTTSRKEKRIEKETQVNSERGEESEVKSKARGWKRTSEAREERERLSGRPEIGCDNMITLGAQR